MVCRTVSLWLSVFDIFYPKFIYFVHSITILVSLKNHYSSSFVHSITLFPQSNTLYPKWNTLRPTETFNVQLKTKHTLSNWKQNTLFPIETQYNLSNLNKLYKCEFRRKKNVIHFINAHCPNVTIKTSEIFPEKKPLIPLSRYIFL